MPIDLKDDQTDRDLPAILTVGDICKSAMA
jgi:hypothetical protein